MLLFQAIIAASVVGATDDDLAWQNNPRQWHQQLARIVDHRFLTFDDLEKFATNAKKAGVGALMLVQIQKSAACPGTWYNGLQLCDHINGSNPAAGGTLEQWQKLAADLRPMRLMWWTNPTYWSVQGKVWAQAKEQKRSEVGRFFSWNVSEADRCFGANPDGGDGVRAQGSWGSEGAGKGIDSAMASFGSPSYADYLVDSMANSWTRNLGIDGYTIDCSANYPPGRGKGDQCPHGMLQTGGDAQGVWGKIVARVKALQPQVVLSGEGFGSWAEVIHSGSDIGGQGFGEYHTRMQGAILEGDASNVEDVARTSGADAATILCYLHPHYDGAQPGACPTMYFRDATAVIRDLRQHQMWVALEAASGVVPQHDFDPDSVCRTGPGGFNGCSGGKGAWWNVTNDPHGAEGVESPLWAFTKYRALNRLAIRTKLTLATTASRTGAAADVPVGVGVGADPAPPRYTVYPRSNCYNGAGGTEIDTAPVRHKSVEQCTLRCDEDPRCDCVTFCADGSGECSLGDCWKRSACDPRGFEVDKAAQPYSVYVKKDGPGPPPKEAGGALAYLKHDSLGPRGDAAIIIFNPGAAQTLTVDLSMLPPSLVGGSVVPFDLFTANESRLPPSSVTAAAAAATSDRGSTGMTMAPPPLQVNWTISMGAGEMRAYGGFSLGVFAPRKGKKAHCEADDGYSRRLRPSTMQECFLECARDSRCDNILVDFIDIVWMEAPPPATCTLLGAVSDPATACKEGNGTLVNRLEGARPCAHLWEDSMTGGGGIGGGGATPLAFGAPAVPVPPEPPSPRCAPRAYV